MGWAWIIVIAASIVIECLTLGMVTVWFAIGGLAAYGLYILGAGLAIQIVLFIVVSLILLIFTRPVATKYLKIGKNKTNIDALIGQRAKVLTKINNLNNEGSVQVKGQIWSARALYEDEEIEKDAIVYIKKIEGVKLIVSKNE